VAGLTSEHSEATFFHPAMWYRVPVSLLIGPAMYDPFVSVRGFNVHTTRVSENCFCSYSADWCGVNVSVNLTLAAPLFLLSFGNSRQAAPQGIDVPVAFRRQDGVYQLPRGTDVLLSDRCTWHRTVCRSRRFFWDSGLLWSAPDAVFPCDLNRQLLL
jgi:hypothetical protein